MSNNLGSFERLEFLVSNNTLGFLGVHVLQTIQDLASIPRILGKENASFIEVFEYLKSKQITVGFSKYGSSNEKSAGLTRNFTLYSEVLNEDFTQGPMHFYWNGSPEGLEFEMQKDVTILNNQFGFMIHNKGYDKTGDVSL